MAPRRTQMTKFPCPPVSCRPKVGKCTCSTQLQLRLGQQLASMSVEAALPQTYQGALGLRVLSPVLTAPRGPLCTQALLNSDEETTICLPSRTGFPTWCCWNQQEVILRGKGLSMGCRGSTSHTQREMAKGPALLHAHQSGALSTAKPSWESKCEC